MNKDFLFSSVSNEWETPVELFSLLNKEFHFTLDAASTDQNHKCKKYYTQKNSGLEKSWAGERVYLNPPYGRSISRWMKKAYESSLQPNTSVVCLIPSRTDTKWFHDYAVNGDIRFLKGRLKFINRTLPSWRPDGNFKVTPAPFPSMIVIFDASYVYDNEPPMIHEFPYYEFLT